MTWDARDWQQTPQQGQAPPPQTQAQSERPPRAALPAGPSAWDIWETPEGADGERVPLALRRAYEDAGLIDNATWTQWKRLVTRGIPEL